MNKKNGVKLLAAMAVLAMMFAGAFIITGSENSDAESATINTVSGIEAAVAGEYSAAKSILVSTDMTISLKSTTDADLKVYLVSGKTLMVTGTADNVLDIEVYVASADAKIEGTTKTGSYEQSVKITIDDLKATTVKITDKYETTSTNSTITITGDATGATVTGTDGKTNVGDSGLKTNVTPTSLSNVGFGVSVTNQTQTTYYKTGANVNTVNLALSGDSVKVINGSAIISQGSNVIELKGVTSTEGIVVAYGANYPSITGAVAAGTITVKSGTFIDYADVSTNGTDSFTGFPGKSNLVVITANFKSYYTSQVVAKISSDNVTAASINGNIIQKASVDLDSTAATKTITVASGANYVISETATVKVGTLTIAGDNTDVSTIRIMGQLETYTALTAAGAVDTTKDQILIGPSGYYATNAGVSTKGVSNGNTNVYEGDNFEIKGVPSMPSIGDAILTGDLIIPEKTTFTVNGNLGLNGHKITVNGTLVISKNASIYGTNPAAYTTENITLATTGKIQNQGSIGSTLPVSVGNGAMSVVIQGVDGLEFGFKKVGNGDKLAISGDLKANRNAVNSIVTINGAVIAGNLTIGKDVTVTMATGASAAVDVLKGSIVIVNGTLDGATTYGYNFGENTEITVNGILKTNVPVNMLYGTYGDDGKVSGTATYVVVKNSATFVKGFTVYNEKVAVTGDNDVTTFYLRVFMNGTLDITAPEGTTAAAGTLNISGSTIYIKSGEPVNVKKQVTLDIDNGVVLNGDITFLDGSVATIESYTGAYYVVTVTGTNPSTTKYYTTLDNALVNIDSADYKTITVNLEDLATSFDIGADQVVNLNLTGEIASEAVVNVNKDGTLAGTIPTVEGMLVVMPDASSVTPGSYASKKVGSDGTITYAGFAVSVQNAQPGDVINIDSAQVGNSDKAQNLSVPKDVKIVISDTLNVYGNLAVPEGAELVGGAIVVTGTPSRIAEIKVAGTMDLSSGSLSGSNNNLTSTGTVLMSSSFSGMNINGASYYQNSDGMYVLTTVTKAAADARSITVAGTVSETSDLDLSGKTMVLDEGAKVTLGKITLEATGKIDSTKGELTATVSATDGKEETTGATATGVLKVVKSSLVIESKKTTNAAGVSTYAFTFSTIDGEMTLAEGSMTVNDDLTASTGSKFTIASDATLNILNGTTTINGDNVVFTVDGTMAVKNATVSFVGCDDKKAAVINGTLDIQNAGSVTAVDLAIPGTLNVVKSETEEGTFIVNGTNVKVGSAMKTVGANASIVGPVNFTAGYILAYAGADMSKAVIDEASEKTTAYYVNGVLYATAYTTQSVGITEPVTVPMLNAIDGVDELSTVTWKDVEGTAVTTGNIGDKDALYVSMEASKITITLSITKGVSLWIDDVSSTKEAKLTVGEHNVKVTVDPGYKGTTVITFNGQTVTDGKITVTSDMDGKNVILAATGNISIDNGSSSQPSTGGNDDDSGMGITDYLLIVLVVLAAILVVIVAIRMMRS